MKKLLILLSLTNILKLPIVNASQAGEDDQLVKFSEDYQILSLPEDEKTGLYQELDKIKKDTKNHRSASTYSQVNEFQEDDDYVDFLMETNESSQIIYLGYETCHYCQAFLPKINQLAKEYELEINYYNVLRFEGGQSYDLVKDLYKIDTVPYAFIVKDNKVIDSINYDSSMDEIEEFMQKASSEK